MPVLGVVMDVRCQKCAADYDFDEARIPPHGLSVKCSACGSVFRVFRAVNKRSGDKSGEPFVLRRADGATVEFKDMSTLQRWLVERKVGWGDELSKNGRGFVRLGDISELKPFFASVAKATADAPANRGKAQWEAGGAQEMANIDESGNWEFGGDANVPVVMTAKRGGRARRADAQVEAQAAARVRKRHRRGPIFLFAVLMLAGFVVGLRFFSPALYIKVMRLPEQLHGYFVTKRIVVEHQGVIRVEENSGGGAKFVIEIPGAGAARRIRPSPTHSAAVGRPWRTCDGTCANAVSSRRSMA